MKPKVFISHSSRDTWVARQLAAHIRNCGADTFLDESDIQHGDDFEEEILKAEETSTELLVLLTPWALERTYIWLEIGFFRRGGKRIVGVLHGVSHKDIATDERIAVLLKKIDLVDINAIDSYFEQLRKRVSRQEHDHAH
jgi:hypothetical protein